MKLEIISILISVISLFISGLLFYLDFLRSFNPQIHLVGRVSFLNDPYSPNEERISIILPLIFNNVGARLGYIEDLAVAFETPEHKKVLFRSLIQMLDNSLNLSPDLRAPKMQPFYGFSLDKRATENRTILFKQFDHEEDVKLVAGNYNLILFYKTSKSEEWQEFKKQKLSFSVHQYDVDSLKKKSVENYSDGSYFIKITERNKPFDYAEDALKKLKEKLK